MSESLELIVSGKGCEKDIRMVERAIRQRWDVPDRLRRKCIDHCEKILDDPSVTPRNALSAFKALIQADKINWLEESGEKDRKQKSVEFTMDAVRDLSARMASDPQYRRYLQERTGADDPGELRQDSLEGGVPDPEAHPVP